MTFQCAWLIHVGHISEILHYSTHGSNNHGGEDTVEYKIVINFWEYFAVTLVRNENVWFLSAIPPKSS